METEVSSYMLRPNLDLTWWDMDRLIIDPNLIAEIVVTETNLYSRVCLHIAYWKNNEKKTST